MDNYQAQCPRNDCEGVIPVPGGLPAGEYQCICWAATLRLSWETTGDDGRPIPALSWQERRS